MIEPLELRISQGAIQSAMELLHINIDSTDYGESILALFYLALWKLYFTKKLSRFSSSPSDESINAWYLSLFGYEINHKNNALPSQITFQSIQPSPHQAESYPVEMGLIYPGDNIAHTEIIYFNQNELDALLFSGQPSFDSSNEALLPIAPRLSEKLFSASVVILGYEPPSSIVVKQFGLAFQEECKSTTCFGLVLFDGGQSLAEALIKAVIKTCQTAETFSRAEEEPKNQVNVQVEKIIKTIEEIDNEVRKAKKARLLLSKRSGNFIDRAETLRTQLIKSCGNSDLVQFYLEIKTIADQLNFFTKKSHRSNVCSLLQKTEAVLFGEISDVEFLEVLQTVIKSYEADWLKPIFSKRRRIRNLCQHLLGERQEKNRQAMRLAFSQNEAAEPLRLLRVAMTATKVAADTPEILFGSVAAVAMAEKALERLASIPLDTRPEYLALTQAGLALLSHVDGEDAKMLARQLQFLFRYPYLINTIAEEDYASTSRVLREMLHTLPEGEFCIPVSKVADYFISQEQTLTVSRLTTLFDAVLLPQLLDHLQKIESSEDYKANAEAKRSHLMTTIGAAIDRDIGEVNQTTLEFWLKRITSQDHTSFNANIVRAKWFIAHFGTDGFIYLMDDPALQKTFDLAHESLQEHLLAAINEGAKRYLKSLPADGFIIGYHLLDHINGRDLLKKIDINKQAVIAMVENMLGEADGEKWFKLFTEVVNNEVALPKALYEMIIKDEELRKQALQLHFNWIANFGSKSLVTWLIGIFYSTFERGGGVSFTQLEGTSIKAKIDFKKEPFKTICAQAIKRKVELIADIKEQRASSKLNELINLIENEVGVDNLALLLEADQKKALHETIQRMIGAQIKELLESDEATSIDNIANFYLNIQSPHYRGGYLKHLAGELNFYELVVAQLVIFFGKEDSDETKKLRIIENPAFAAIMQDDRIQNLL